MIWRLLSILGLLAFGFQSWTFWREWDALIVYAFDRSETALAIEAHAHGLLQDDQLAARIESAIATGDLATADSYAALIESAGGRLPSDIQTQLTAAKAPWNRWPVVGGDWLKGFVIGESDNLASLSGAVTSDFLVIGDLRDLGEAGIAYSRGETVDETIVALSALGVALSAGTVLTAGSIGPAKFGAGALKGLLRGGRIAAPLRRELGDLVQKALPRHRLFAMLDDVFIRNSWQGSGSLTSHITRGVKRHADPQALTRLQTVAADLATVEKSAGLAGVWRLSAVAENSADLARLAKITPITGKRSLAFQDSLGKGFLKLSKTSLKWSVRLWLELAALITGLLAMLGGLVGHWAFNRTVKAFRPS